MKNNKFVFLIVFVVSLFSFNFEVNAAQELTCLYKREVMEQSKTLLIQDANGNKYVYKNYYDVNEDLSGWVEVFDYSFDLVMKYVDLNNPSNPNPYINDEGILLTCPPYVDTTGNGRVNFDGYVNFNRGLEKGYPLYEAKFPSNSVVSPSENLDGDGCSVDSWLNELDTSKYTGACLYVKPISDSGVCHLVQINFGKDYIQTTEYDSQKGVRNSGLSYFFDETIGLSGEFKVDFTLEEFLKNNGECSESIRVKRDALICEPGMTDCTFSPYINTELYLKEEKKTDFYYLVNSKGTNPFTGENLKTFDEIVYHNINLLNCSDLFDENAEELKDLIKTIYTIIRFLIPIVIVALSTVDFAKSIFSGNEDEMKKTTKRFMNRLIVAVCIFLAPILLKFILKIAYEIWGILSPDFCGIL